MKDQNTKFHPIPFRYFLFLVLALVGFSAPEISAQEIKEINAYVKANDIQPSDSFMDLRYGSAGIIEIAAGNTVLPKNPNAKNVLIKSSDLGSLPSEPGKFGSVQFMQVNVDGGTFSLDYNQLVGFPALRFILIASPTPLSEAQLSQMLPGFEESGIVILYQISRPG